MRFAKAASLTAAAAALGVLTERCVLASPPYKGPVTDHFDGRRFHNVDPTWDVEGSFLRWQLTKQPGHWPAWIEEGPGPRPVERVNAGRVRVTWVNHATLLVQMDGVNVLTDPMWSERCSPVSFAGPKRHRAPGLRFEELPPIDAVLVSHNHYDHLDLPTLRRLRGPRIFTPLGNAALMKRGGVENAFDLDWWQEARIDDHVKITLVPAQHFCARGISDRDRTLWGGFVISGPSGHVYFAGDTGMGPHFAEIGARFQPMRAALLPIGAYLPRWFMRPVHVSPEEAVDAHLALKARTSIAMHFATFHLGDDGYEAPARDLQAALAKRGVTDFLILRHGEGFEAP